MVSTKTVRNQLKVNRDRSTLLVSKWVLSRGSFSAIKSLRTRCKERSYFLQCWPSWQFTNIHSIHVGKFLFLCTEHQACLTRNSYKCTQCFCNDVSGWLKIGDSRQFSLAKLRSRIYKIIANMIINKVSLMDFGLVISGGTLQLQNWSWSVLQA